MLIILGGLPGTGKTVARELARQLGLWTHTEGSPIVSLAQKGYSLNILS